MSEKNDKTIKEIMTHQGVFTRLEGSNEKDLMKAANSAKKHLKGK